MIQNSLLNNQLWLLCYLGPNDTGDEGSVPQKYSDGMEILTQNACTAMLTKSKKQKKKKKKLVIHFVVGSVILLKPA